MARPIPEGDYLILNANNLVMALDVSGANRNNGANVQVWGILNNRAQLFSVRYNSDDTVRILAAFTGKSVDVSGGNIVNGTNVQQWTNNDTRAQKWVIAPTGNTVEFHGKTYSTYKIQIAADTSFVLDVAGTAATAGANCVLWKDDGGTDQHWIFMQRPKLRSGGVYEIHSAVDPRYVVAVGASSKTDGANVLLWQTAGINDQKWVIVDEGDNQWRIRNVNSGKYLDIKGNEAKNGATCVQWGEPVSVRHQQWKILERDSNDHIYNGVSCAFVSIGAYGVTSDGNTYMLHSYNSTATNNADVNLWEDAGGNGYRWILYPVCATDETIPIPANIGLADKVGSYWAPTRRASGIAYATWTCTKSWTNSSPNHYETRIRERYMSSQNSTWGEWSDWTAWETANCSQAGTQAWLADPIDGTFNIANHKSKHVEFQVRCVGVEELSNLVGRAATQDFYFVYKPTFTFTDVGIMPEGLVVGYQNDYPCGMCNMTIELVCRNGSGEAKERNILTKELLIENMDSSGSFLIPYGYLNGEISDGDRLELFYYGGTDQISKVFNSNVLVTAREDAGFGLDATPTLTNGEGRTIVATVPYDDARMWLKLDGEVIELTDVGGDGESKFVIPYPFGRDFTIFTSVQSGDNWGTNSTEILSTNPLVYQMPCHAWNWDGGSFLLEANSSEGIRTDRTLKPTYIASTLNSRERQSVTFAQTINGEFKAAGILYDNVTESTIDQLIELVNKHHVRYRAPSGESANVAITGATYTCQPNVTFVEVTMIEETV